MDVSEQALKAFFEHVPVAFYRCIQKGLDRKFQLATPHVHALLGMTPEQLLLDSRAFFRRIHPEDRNKFLRAWADQTTLPAVISVEYRIVIDENRVILIQEHSVLSLDEQGQGNVCQGVLLEIPNYQVVKDELRRWDQELQSLTENLPDIIGRIDHKNRILYLNRWWDSPEHFPPEKYLGKRLEDLGLSQKVADIFEMKIANVLESGMPATFEISHPTFKGMKNFEVRFCPEPAIGKHILTVLMICRDITDVRTAELAFKESDEKFLQLAEAIDSVFWIWDIELQRIVYVSSAYERLWGGNIQKLLSNPFDWLSIVSPEDRTKVENLFLKRLDGASLDIEYRVIGPNEEIRWVHNRTYPLNDASGKISRIIGLAQDITERKKWEEERMRGAKLESLGLLAGGLAHDFNNLLTAILGQLSLAKYEILLTAILGQLSLAKYEIDTAHPLFSRLSEAEQASLRAQDIAQQLLTFSKGGDPVKNIVSLGTILEENVRLVLAGSNVRPVFRDIQGLWAVNVDLGQICQVLHNLVINARQSMESGGECLIEAKNVSIEEGERLIHSHQLALSQDHSQGQWIRITVQDQGIGISNENLAKVFDPYFTTKSTGSGLGLATSYSIIRNHGGVLWAESEVGVGSRFSFLLPALSPGKVAPPLLRMKLNLVRGIYLSWMMKNRSGKCWGKWFRLVGIVFKPFPMVNKPSICFVKHKTAGNPFLRLYWILRYLEALGEKKWSKKCFL
jgi:PAS domain S-box-containing protein